MSKISKAQAKEQIQQALANAYAQGGKEACEAILPVIKQTQAQVNSVIEALEAVIKDADERVQLDND